MGYQPRSAPPAPPSLRDDVARGDMAAVRARFDRLLWEDNHERPTWAHLQIAVARQDVAMARLLVTWGARAGEEDLATLKKSQPQKYPAYLQTLRRAGHGISPRALREGAAMAEAVKNMQVNESVEPYQGRQLIDGQYMDPRAAKLPSEWRHLLQNIHQNGAPEAVIGGGALRDLFNNRAIKDVDIFLNSRGSEKKNRKFIEKAFNTAALPVHRQVTSHGYGDIAVDFPDPSRGTFVQRISRGYATIRAASNSEAWTVYAGPQKTEYNIIFIDGPLGAAMEKAGRSKDPLSDTNQSPAQLIIRHFDFGLCQIAFDGADLHSTKSYEQDVQNKTITLQKENGTSGAHLQRIVKKYPDHKLCEESRKFLNKPKPAPKPVRRSSGYGGYGGSFY